VESLVQKKQDVDREEIKGLEAGQVTVDGPAKTAKLFSIPCKNPLDAKREVNKAPESARKATLLQSEGTTGGLITHNISKLSVEDAEATRELLKDATKEDDGAEALPAVAPILMREGSKNVREGNAPDASKDMYDKVPVSSFGEALLRGMGYDPEKHTTKPVFRDKLRDTHLGLGAKALTPAEKIAATKKRKAAQEAASATAQGGSGEQSSSQAPATLESNDGQGSSASSVQHGGSVPHAAQNDHDANHQQHKRQHIDNMRDSVTAQATTSKALDVWASRGLVVRVVGKDERFRDFFGAEAVVLEADEVSGRCRIKARAGEKSHVLQGVPLSDLETRVGRTCQQVRIVRGSKKGAIAKLLRRDTQRSVAKIQIEGKDVEMALDDVCQFMA